MKRKVTHMDLGLLRKIVSEAKELSKEPYMVGFCGIGDPLLHPELEEALKIVSELPRIALGTNCQALDKERRKLVINSGFSDITLSLDAITEKTHKKMRPGLNFNTVMYNVLGFLNELRGLKRFWRYIYLQIIPTRDNIDELPLFIESWKKEIEDIEGAVVFVKPMYKWPGLDNPYYPGPQVKTDNDPKILWGPFESDTRFRDGCSLFDNWVMIQSNGAYQPCCMNVEDDFKVGNVKDSSILELYNSKKMEHYRKLAQEKRYDEIPFCANCN
jgi:radical SAM protein with 4Fe4S-binding SPASM domain